MSATPIANGNAPPAPFADAMFDQGDAPQLRTLLLTDICDSTGLVEVLGDKGAAQLFREHDRLVMALQQQWRGRLIDRSDGLLLLFERPIDGLGFAIDYARGLADIGKLRSIDIRNRAGLHVGEVLTWRNSEESVRVGAKPIEVEGLAKPTAARLMSMARPGQILLSAVAEPLAHRAARELGERGQHLVWKSLGRWRFKGVPEPQEIFEVGEPGIAPLRAPPNSPKAWRAVPLWRRPAMLAAQLALVVAVGIGGWFVTRPAPAIAFGERDWVVVGDLRNLTGQTVLDESLEQAFRISLEQSRHVNVLSDLKTRDTLARMQLPADTVIDRDIASEIALRDGARAVILPTVAEVGGRVRFSAEIIDPASQTTVYAASFDGDGAPSALDSIDRVTASLREEFGEAIRSIEDNSAPLAQVTTENLDALRAYSLAQEAYARHDYVHAERLFQRATELDPEFALAWLGQVRVFYSQENAPAALEALRTAQRLKSHLTPRESLYLAAWLSEFDEPRVTARKWAELAELYPDYYPGLGNAGLWLYKENRFDEALAHATAAAQPQNPLIGHEYDSVGRARLGLEQYDQAEAAFKRSYEMTGGSLRRLVATAAARGDFEAAGAYARDLDADSAFSYIERTSIAVDQGDLKGARYLSEMALRIAGDGDSAMASYLLIPAATAQWVSGNEEPALVHLRKALEKSSTALAEPSSSDSKEHVAVLLSVALLAYRMDEPGVARSAMAIVDGHKALLQVPQLAQLADVVAAVGSTRVGNADAAIRLLQPHITGRELFQARVALMEAHHAAGELAEALEHARWIKSHRGRAYIELLCGHCLQAMNVADATLAQKREAELLEQLGQAPGAASSRAAT